MCVTDIMQLERLKLDTKTRIKMLTIINRVFKKVLNLLIKINVAFILTEILFYCMSMFIDKSLSIYGNKILCSISLLTLSSHGVCLLVVCYISGLRSYRRTSYQYIVQHQKDNPTDVLKFLNQKKLLHLKCILSVLYFNQLHIALFFTIFMISEFVFTKIGFF